MGGLLCRKDDEVICISVELGQGAEDTLQGLCLQKPKNVSRLNITGNQILHEELCLFSKLKWNHLIYLRLNDNNIGPKGCKYLSRVPLPKIRQVIILYNQIGNEGALHFSKAQWKKLQNLHLVGNHISSLKWLGKVEWERLKYFQMRSIRNQDENFFTFEQMQHLLLLQSNFDRQQGLFQLSYISLNVVSARKNILYIWLMQRFGKDFKKYL